MNNLRLLAFMGGKKNVIPWYLAGNTIPSDRVLLAYSSDAASYAASKVNLINPGTNDLDDTGHLDITWDSSGWTFSPTGYFDTGITLSAGAYTVVIKIENLGSAGYFFGTAPNNSTGIFELRYLGGSSMRMYSRTGGDTQTYTSLPAAGTIGWVPDLTTPKLFVDGVSVGLAAMYNIGAASSSLYLGASNAYTGALTSTMKISRVAVYQGILSDVQLAAVTNP